MEEVRGCLDCDCDTKDEYYMVTQEVWRAAGMKEGFLCIDCLETRIGRVLNANDFTKVPLNSPFHERAHKRSERLRDRMSNIE